MDSNQALASVSTVDREIRTYIAQICQILPPFNVDKSALAQQLGLY
jgi:hypothetical protein